MTIILSLPKIDRENMRWLITQFYAVAVLFTQLLLDNYIRSIKDLWNCKENDKVCR